MLSLYYAYFIYKNIGDKSEMIYYVKKTTEYNYALAHTLLTRYYKSKNVFTFQKNYKFRGY